MLCAKCVAPAPSESMWNKSWSKVHERGGLLLCPACSHLLLVIRHKHRLEIDDFFHHWGTEANPPITAPPSGGPVNLVVGQLP